MFKPLLARIPNSLPDDIVASTSVIVRDKLIKTLYTNADQFLNKRDLFLAQIAGKNSPRYNHDYGDAS